VCPSSEICVASQCIACRSREICGNGIDDDCNGLKDDGCGVSATGGAGGVAGASAKGGAGGIAGTAGMAGAGGDPVAFGGAGGGSAGDGGGTAHPDGGMGGSDAGASGMSGTGGTGGAAAGTSGGAGASGKGGAGTGGTAAAGAGGKSGAGGAGGSGTSGTGGSGGNGISGYNACIVFESYNHTTSTACADCQVNSCMVDTIISCFDSRQKTCEPMCTDVFGSVDIPCFCMCMVKTADCGVKIGNAYGCVVAMCSASCM
jgi:hypothetical protein